MLFSKFKEFLCATEARTVDALIDSMVGALRTVTRSDILGWFNHAGDRYSQ